MKLRSKMDRQNIWFAFRLLVQSHHPRNIRAFGVLFVGPENNLRALPGVREILTPVVCTSQNMGPFDMWVWYDKILEFFWGSLISKHTHVATNQRKVPYLWFVPWQSPNAKVGITSTLSKDQKYQRPSVKTMSPKDHALTGGKFGKKNQRHQKTYKLISKSLYSIRFPW